MKILLTGATGFIGTHLTKRLVADGHTLWATARSDGDGLALREGGITPLVLDNRTESLAAVMTKERFDGVIHLASLFLAAHQTADVVNLIDSNVRFGTQILEAAAQTQVRWFINTGTFWQHYHNQPYSPVNLYAASKQAFEDIARYYWETAPICFTTLALSDTFGPADPRPKILNLLHKTSQSGETLALSPGDQLIDISYIDNVIDAYTQLITLAAGPKAKSLTGQTFAVNSGAPLSLKKLVEIFEQATGTTLTINWGARPYRPREVMTPWNEGRPVPGWKPKTSLAEGIKKTFHA